jgi:hypothetical protein
MFEVFERNNILEMRKSREASWLCKIFQESHLDASEKQLILRRLIEDLKEKEDGEGETGLGSEVQSSGEESGSVGC